MPFSYTYDPVSKQAMDVDGYPGTELTQYRAPPTTNAATATLATTATTATNAQNMVASNGNTVGATGTSTTVTLTAAGAGSNIDLQLAGKGLGVATCQWPSLGMSMGSTQTVTSTFPTMTTLTNSSYDWNPFSSGMTVFGNGNMQNVSGNSQRYMVTYAFGISTPPVSGTVIYASIVCSSSNRRPGKSVAVSNGTDPIFMSGAGLVTLASNENVTIGVCTKDGTSVTVGHASDYNYKVQYAIQLVR